MDGHYFNGYNGPKLMLLLVAFFLSFPLQNRLQLLTGKTWHPCSLRFFSVSFLFVVLFALLPVYVSLDSLLCFALTCGERERERGPEACAWPLSDFVLAFFSLFNVYGESYMGHGYCYDCLLLLWEPKSRLGSRLLCRFLFTSLRSLKFWSNLRPTSLSSDFHCSCFVFLSGPHWSLSPTPQTFPLSSSPPLPLPLPLIWQWVIIELVRRE